MSVQLNKYYTKNANQNWVLSIDVSKCLYSNTPDPRDSLFASNISTVGTKIKSSYIVNIESSIGYQGFDRTWIDDNTLKFTYYFETDKNALDFYLSIKNSNAQIIANNFVTHNPTAPQFQIKWEIVSNNQTVQISEGTVSTGVPI
jgi:hypothetical protein